MKHPALLLLSLLSALPLQASEPLVVQLWPSGAPEKPGVTIEAEKRIEPKNEKDVVRVTNVTDPTLTVYRPNPPVVPNGTAVLVCPGGGYGILAIEHEGTQVCDWLNSLGVTAILLKYRVPVRDKTPGYEPLQDAQRAIGIVRRNALQWGINPGRVGILGFSAGGHLSVMTALHANERTYPNDPMLDVTDATPNFLIPIYPAYLVSKDDASALTPLVHVTPAAPPICLVHAHDDNGTTSAAASALLYMEYKKLKLPAELHIFSSGGHGFGMRKTEKPVSQWPARVGEWMRSMGLLDPAPGQ